MYKTLVAGLGLLVLASACGSPAGTAASAARTAPVGSATSPPAGPTPSTYVPASTTNAFDVPSLMTAPPASSAAQFSGITCAGAIGSADAVGVVTLHAGGTVLRDYADAAHPRTVCQFPSAVAVDELLDAHHVLLGGAGSLYAVVKLPEVTSTFFQLPDGNGVFSSLIAVSPRLDAIVYTTADNDNMEDRVHLATSAGDRIVASLPNPHAGRCGSPEDSRSGDFTHSGDSFYVLDQPTASFSSLLVVRNGQAQVMLTPPGLFPAGVWAPGSQPAMAVWSPTSDDLYVRRDAQVWKWTPDLGFQLFLPGVAWYYPTISADGTHLAYAVVRPDGLHDVYLVDLAHRGGPQLIGKGARNLPVFLDATQVWYRSEAPGICGAGGNLPLIYDLADGSEAPSIIDFVISVWPSTSSNF